MIFDRFGAKLDVAFNAFDCNGDGDVELREFRHVLTRLVPNMSETGVDVIMDLLVLDENECVGFQQFCLTFARPVILMGFDRVEKCDRKGRHVERESELWHVLWALRDLLKATFDTPAAAFGWFDTFHRGRISPMELLRGLERLGLCCGRVLSYLLHALLDEDSDGTVLDEEFMTFIEEDPEPEGEGELELFKGMKHKWGSLEGAFHSLDVRQPHGKLTPDEVVLGLVCLAQELDLHFRFRKRHFLLLFRRMDKDRRGAVDLEQFTTTLTAWSLKHEIKELDLDMSDDDDEEELAMNLLGGHKKQPHTVHLGGLNLNGKVELMKGILTVLRSRFSSLFTAFQTIDSNNDGRISAFEVRAALALLGLDLSVGQMDMVMQVATDTGLEEEAPSQNRSKRAVAKFLDYPMFLRMFHIQPD